MTDLPAPPPRDPDELDPLASALVDGLLPPEEAARAQQDPEIRQRVDQIHNTRAALRATPSPDPQATETAIAAALAAFDTELAADSRPSPPIPQRQPGAPPQSPPHGWPAEQRRRGGASRPWLAAAAAILVAVLAIGLLTRTTDDSEDMASQETSGEPSDGDQAEESGGSGTDDAGASATPRQESAPSDRTETGAEIAPTIPALGNVPTIEEIATRVRASLDAGVTPPPDEAAALDEGMPCDQLTVAGDPARGTPVYVADATLADNPVRIHVYETPQGQQMVVTDHNTCTTVADQPLEP